MPILCQPHGIKWIFRDNALADLATGNINGTAATPGPGDRTVADVESALEIASGWYEWTAQAISPVYAEQELVFADKPITRAAGQIVMCKWRCATDGNCYPLALVDDPAPAWDQTNVVHGFQRAATALTLTSVDDEAAGVNLMPFVADGTEYWLMMVLTATGCYYFAQGGAFTELTFLRFSAGSITTTPLYVASAGYDAVFSTTKYRVPKDLSGELVAEA